MHRSLTIQKRLKGNKKDTNKVFLDDLGGDFSRSQIAFPKYDLEEKPELEIQKPAAPTINFAAPQVKPAAASQKPQDQELFRVLRFIIANRHINFKNYQQARKVLFSFFREESKFRQNFVSLAQKLDEFNQKSDGLSSIHLSSNKLGQFCIEKVSKELGRTKEYIDLNFKSKSLCSHFIGLDKLRIVQVTKARSHKFQNTESSRDFDVKFWRSHNLFALEHSSLKRSLECLERNSLALDAFVAKVNTADWMLLFSPKLIQDAKIKTNKRDFSTLDFKTLNGQALSAQIGKTRCSIQVTY